MGTTVRVGKVGFVSLGDSLRGTVHRSPGSVTHWRAHRYAGDHTVWCLSRRNAIAYVLGTPYHLLAPVGRMGEP